MKKLSIGGQALIEGIMMKSPTKTAMAVRTPDKSIDIEYMDGTSNSFTLRKGDGARIEGYRLRLAEAEKNHNAKLKRIMNEYTFIKEKKMDDNGYKSKQQHLMELNKELKALRNAESDILMHELSEKVLMAKKRYEYFISTGQLEN